MTATKKQEERIVKLLNIQSVLFGILGILGIVFSVLLIILGILIDLIFFDPERLVNTEPNFIDDFEVGLFVLLVYIFSNAILSVVNGFMLRKRLYKSYSIFVAFYGLFGFPLGTVLSFFSLVILKKEETVALYLAEKEQRIEDSIYAR